MRPRADEAFASSSSKLCTTSTSACTPAAGVPTLSPRPSMTIGCRAGSTISALSRAPISAPSRAPCARSRGRRASSRRPPTEWRGPGRVCRSTGGRSCRSARRGAARRTGSRAPRRSGAPPVRGRTRSMRASAPRQPVRPPGWAAARIAAHETHRHFDESTSAQKFHRSREVRPLNAATVGLTTLSLTGRYSGASPVAARHTTSGSGVKSSPGLMNRSFSKRYCLS